MAIDCLSGESFRGQVGNPLAEDVVFQVTDANGAPLKGKHVRLTADPPGSVSFGSDRHAVVETKGDGTVAVKMTPRSFGTHGVMATVAGATGRETATIEVEGYHPEVEVKDMGGRIVALRRAPQPAPSHNYAWPVVAALALLAVAFLAWRVIEKPGTSGGAMMPFPYPVPSTSSPSTVDPDARAKAQAALAAVDQAKQELRDETAQGLTENSTHDQGYTREYVRPVMRQAAVTAREVRQLLASGSGLGGRTRPRICDRDPTLSACR